MWGAGLVAMVDVGRGAGAPDPQRSWRVETLRRTAGLGGVPSGATLRVCHVWGDGRRTFSPLIWHVTTLIWHVTGRRATRTFSQSLSMITFLSAFTYGATGGGAADGG
eukprot:1216326-Prymnesium_polylepis.1